MQHSPVKKERKKESTRMTLFTFYEATVVFCFRIIALELSLYLQLLAVELQVLLEWASV